MAQQPTVIDRGVAVMDPNNSTSHIPNTLKINSDGSINVDASGATFDAGGTATAAAPSYSEGTVNPLSLDLSGNMRVIAESGSTTAVTQATASSLKGEMILLDGAGTNLGTVKAASTQSATTDTSLIVQLSPIGIAPVVSASAESGHVLKNAPGVLRGLDFMTGATSGYLMLFDAIAVPSNGAVTPVKCWPIGANAFLAASYVDQPLKFATGISAGFSTTGPFTLTLSATGYFSAEVI